MKNYADRGGCDPPKPKAESDNTLRDSVIVLLFIQNIFRSSKSTKCI